MYCNILNRVKEKKIYQTTLDYKSMYKCNIFNKLYHNLGYSVYKNVSTLYDNDLFKYCMK